MAQQLDMLTDETILDILNTDQGNNDMTNANDTQKDNAMNKADDILDAVTSGTDELLNTEDKPKATKSKAKRPAKGKAKEEPKEEPKEETPAEPKPEPKMVGGVEVKDDADPEVIAKETEAAAAAFEKVANKDGELLESYLALGGFASKVSPMFASPKLYGQYLAKTIPASAKLDAALRSNCKWLWEALNLPDHEASDILSVLGGINDISSFKSQNPTVIKREYAKAVKAKEAKEALKAEGKEVEDDEEAIKEVSKAAKEAANAEMLKVVEAMFAKLGKDVERSKTKTKDDMASYFIEILGETQDVIGELLIGTKKQAIEEMERIAGI